MVASRRRAVAEVMAMGGCRRLVIAGGSWVRLTPTEAAIARLVAAHEGRPLSMAQMAAMRTASHTESRKNRTTKNSGASTTATRIRARKSDTSVPALAPLIGRDGPVELLLGKVGPQHISKVKFRVGGLPQQEIGQPQLAAGPDNQIGVGNPP